LQFPFVDGRFLDGGYVRLDVCFLAIEDVGVHVLAAGDALLAGQLLLLRLLLLRNRILQSLQQFLRLSNAHCHVPGSASLIKVDGSGQYDQEK
jgi:hypothetical protein